MTTELGRRFLSDRVETEKSTNALSGGSRKNQLVSHLVDAVNTQIQADFDLEKHRIDSAAEVEKDQNSQYYTFLGSTVGVLGL